MDNTGGTGPKAVPRRMAVLRLGLFLHRRLVSEGIVAGLELLETAAAVVYVRTAAVEGLQLDRRGCSLRSATRSGIGCGGAIVSMRLVLVDVLVDLLRSGRSWMRASIEVLLAVVLCLVCSVSWEASSLVDLRARAFPPTLMLF